VAFRLCTPRVFNDGIRHSSFVISIRRDLQFTHGHTVAPAAHIVQFRRVAQPCGPRCGRRMRPRTAHRKSSSVRNSPWRRLPWGAGCPTCRRPPCVGDQGRFPVPVAVDRDEILRLRRHRMPDRKSTWPATRLTQLVPLPDDHHEQQVRGDLRVVIHGHVRLPPKLPRPGSMIIKALGSGRLASLARTVMSAATTPPAE